MKQHSFIDTVDILKLNNTDFKQLASFIEKESGIKMPDHKRVLVQGRLKKRITELGLPSFTEYCNYLFDPQNAKTEILQLLTLISTNKTEFFREPLHFSYLEKQVVPAVFANKKDIKIWSAGCSSGQEAYTIAMVLEELKPKYRGLNYSIFGSDISMKVLNIANKAEYDISKLDAVQINLLRKYFLRHKDRTIKKVRVVPEIRKNVRFKYINFMENEYPITEQFDAIFLRNVLIYFHKEVQKQVILKVIKHLSPNGYLFLGHSESVFGHDLPIKSVGANMYQKL